MSGESPGFFACSHAEEPDAAGDLALAEALLPSAVVFVAESVRPAGPSLTGVPLRTAAALAPATGRMGLTILPTVPFDVASDEPDDAAPATAVLAGAAADAALVVVEVSFFSSSEAKSLSGEEKKKNNQIYKRETQNLCSKAHGIQPSPSR